ncbi:MAG: zf-HC2 domain-containing protein [candidate division Zixibacteria bacterium]|nr:zf-HC2 domain-containing protein [candidate division Zixibacteria bacterium]
MANCRNKKLIGPYIDGHLGECEWLDEHIAECAECLAEYESVQHISHLSQKADFSPPESSYWNKFGTRVIARIAARPRPRPRRYGRIFDSIFANRLAVRLVTPLMVVLITVLAVKTFVPLGNLQTPSTEQRASSPIMNGSGEAEIVNSDNPTDESEAIPEIIDQADPEIIQIVNQPETEDISPEVKPAVVEVIPVYDAGTIPVVEVEKSELDNTEIESSRDFVHEYLSRRPLKTSRSKVSGLVTGAWSNMAADLRPAAFNTDQVIMFQILSGSNPSLAPLSSYHEAAGKFFAPRISTSRNLFELDVTNRWGYASGDDNFNEERLRHLKLELDLMRDK